MNKILKTLTSICLACLLLLTVSPALAASSKGGFSGGARTPSYSSGSYGSGSYSGSSSSGSTQYRSGVRSPSSSVGQTPRNNNGGFGYTQPRSGWGSFFGGMAAGALAGSLFHSMFHPFGGYGYGYGFGHSLFGLIIDALLLYIGYRIIRRLFFR